MEPTIQTEAEPLSSSPAATLDPAEETPSFEAESAGEPAQTQPRRRFHLPPWLFTWQTLSHVLFWIGPFASFCGVELMNGNNPFTDLNAVQITFNLLWYALLYWGVRMVTGRPKLAAGLSAGFCFVIGLLNHYVLTFRGRVIFPCDLVCLQTAWNVAADYDYTPDKTVWAAAAILAVYLLLLCLPPHRRGRRNLGLRARLVSWVLMGGFLFAFFGTGLLPAVGIYAQQWNTQENGWLLNFMTSLRYSFVSAPEDYDLDRVEEIARRYENTEVSSGAEPPENLIVIMNESFADYASFDKLELTEDPTPYYHALTENTVKGTMYSPVTGGGTANVEFEYLTGDSLAFLPSATVAYQLYLYDGAPSLVSQAKALGYDATAFHPYLSSGWNRTSVYPWLGFGEQYYEEDVVDPQYVRKYVSDKSDYQQLYRMTDETEGSAFIFNVTIQNHSGYRQGWNNLERTVELTGGSEGKSGVAAQFFSLMRESDDAIRELIEHYSASDERTMIVFFGDHQPPLENSFYEYLYGKKLGDRSTEEILLQHETPFFIWANYDIPEAQDVRISSNFLGTLSAYLAGFSLTGYQQLQWDVMTELPVATTAGFITREGLVTADESALTERQQALYGDYRIMAYNHLFDEDHHPEGFYD